MAGAALAMPYISRAHAQEEAVLNVFNWTDYIGETTIEDFQSATGIQVTYDLYDSTETMEAKMLSSRSDFDVSRPAPLLNASPKQRSISRLTARN